MAELDRRITIRITRDSVNQFGEPLDETDDFPTWAAFISSSVDRVIGEAGTQGYATRSWRVRFDQRFLTAHEAGSTITVDYGAEDPDIVTGVGEPTTIRGPLRRRRFLDLVT